MKKKFEYLIARRYLKAKRKTGFISIITYISIGGVAIGVTALILVLSVMNGFEQEVRSRLLGADAHIRLRKYLSKPFTEADTVLKIVRSTDHVIGASPAIYEEGMITSKNRQQFTIVKAIDPKTAGTVTDIAEKVKLGSIDFTPKEINGKKLPGIVLGVHLADILYATHIGDVVSVATFPKEAGIFAQPRIMQFYVAGLVEIGYYEYDKVLSYMSIPDAQILFDMPGRITWIEIKLDDYELADEVKDEIVDEKLGYPFYARTWFEMNRSLYSWMEIEKWGSFVILSMIIMVAAFNIVSSLIMMVMEKTREIGILKSMGATSGSILRIFVFEGLLVGIIGTFIGCIIGYSLGFAQLYFGIITLPGDVYLISSLPILMKWTDFFAITTIAIFLSVVASYYPAYKASRLVPVEAIRYE